jgi:nickel-dependent lactate racemase
LNINLAYGRSGLTITLPERQIDVLEPQFVHGLADELGAIQEALRSPIGTAPLVELVKSGDTVVIVHTDITRATPNDRILPVILHELESAGINRGDIFLLNGLGTHRPQTQNELRLMLGDHIVDNYRCLQHDCFDEANLLSLDGSPSGNPVRINRSYLEADVRILTGFIEPHFFAGFSGGPKAIVPSLAGGECVFTNHGYEMISHPNASWGITEGNPIWEEMREIALPTKPTFLVNVALNTSREISGVFAGEMLKAHDQGCAFVKETAMVRVDEPYDIVITTNSGYPLDQNLYQSVKGMSAACQIVRHGGAIIIAAACEDGLPDHGRYAELLLQGGSPQGVLDMVSQPGFRAQDQWQVQIQAQIQLHAQVFVYSDGLTDEQIRDALLLPCGNIEQSVKKLRVNYGSQARICILPEGPQTIPYLR